MEAELLHLDTHKNRRKNMTKLIVVFHNSAKSVEKHVHSRICHIGSTFSAVEYFNHNCTTAKGTNIEGLLIRSNHNSSEGATAIVCHH
jgi:hypothetical protein